MKKSELKEIIKSAMLEEAEDSKKGNKEEQKRAEGAIRDNKKHIKKLAADLKFQEEKLAKLKKDSKKDIIKEYDSDIENQTGEDFGFWFRAGVKAEKQIQQAKDLLTQNGIEFNAEGRFGIDFQGKGYEKREIVQLLRDSGLTRFVIYDHEKEDTINEDIPTTEVFTDAELDMASEMLMDMFNKLGLENNVEKSDALFKYIEGWFETLDYTDSFVNEAEDVEVNKILSSGGYDEIDDEELLATVKGRLKGKSNIGAKALNLLIMKIEDEEGGNIDFTNEAEEVDVEDNEEVDVDIEKDVKIDDESVESDIEVDASMPGENADEIAVQSLLMKAQEEAAKLGDEKLTDQIGNTITYFTRAHVSQVDETENYNSDDVDISTDNPAEDAEIGFALQEVKRFKKRKTKSHKRKPTMKKLNEEFLRMQKLAGIITEETFRKNTTTNPILEGIFSNVSDFIEGKSDLQKAVIEALKSQGVEIGKPFYSLHYEGGDGADGSNAKYMTTLTPEEQKNMKVPVPKGADFKNAGKWEGLNKRIVTLKDVGEEVEFTTIDGKYNFKTGKFLDQDGPSSVDLMDSPAFEKEMAAMDKDSQDKFYNEIEMVPYIGSPWYELNNK